MHIYANMLKNFAEYVAPPKQSDENDEYRIHKVGARQRVLYHPNWASFHQRFVDRLWELCPMRYNNIKGPGMVVGATRLFQPYGTYPYIISMTEYPCRPLFKELVDIIEHLEGAVGGTINAVVIDYYITPRNTYRKNSKRIRLHTDNEPYSFLSIGEPKACRRLQVAGIARNDAIASYPLMHGSLVSFLNGAYEDYVESVPEETDECLFEDNKMILMHFCNYRSVVRYDEAFAKQRKEAVSIFDASFDLVEDVAPDTQQADAGTRRS